MASLKEVKNRIISVKSTRQITSAMKMVASAKLHKAQGRIENMLPYQRKLNEILTNFLEGDTTFKSPYVEIRPVSRIAIVVLSSNSSLCGAYNSNVVRMLEHTLEEYHSLGKENILIFPIGRKIEEAVKKMGYEPQGSYQQMADMLEMMSENKNSIFNSEDCNLFRVVSNRADRLYDNTKMLREYTVQLREMYQSQIDIEQNRTMKVLTVVTVIIMPLTLIAGWYGMNFQSMPELKSPYGYWGVIILSIVVIIVEIIIFKWKKWFD